ncbi:MAG: hypothetical protein PHI71_02390, partial [Acidiphilium sp.]|nr:hypothetical protein [Acidiphilium sp.]
MKKALSILALSTALAGPGLAHAAVTMPPVAVNLGVGTEGIGGGISTQLVPHTLNLNIGLSRFGHNFHFTADNANFSSHLRLGAIPIVLAWYPFHGNFSLNAGVYINQNQVSATATPDAGGIYTINGNRYTASQVGSMSGKTHFNQVAPYVGVGWGNPFDGGRWTFLANAGAMYEGNPQVRLSATGAASNPQLAAAVAAAQRSVNSKLHLLNWWPVVTFGVA